MIYISDFDGPGAVVCAVQSTADTDDDKYRNTVLLMDATGQSDGTGYTTEESWYGRPLTYNGNAQITSSKFVFDGPADSITLSDNARFTPSSRATWEVYGFNPNSHAGDNGTIAAHWRVDLNQRSWKFFYDDTGSGSGTIRFSGSTDGNVGTVVTVEATGIDQGTSYDIFVSWDGTTLRLYVDGVFKDSDTFSAFHNSNRSVFVGIEDGGGDALNGSFTALRMTIGRARYTTEVGCQYRSKMPLPVAHAFTDPNWDHVVLLQGDSTTDASTIFVDDSQADLPLTGVGNAQTDTGDKKFGSGSWLLDGNGDNLTAVLSASLDCTNSNDKTYEAWVKVSAYDTGANQTIFDTRQSSGTSRGFTFVLTSAGVLAFQAFDSSGTVVISLTSSGTVSAGSWTHVAATRASGTWKIFINGNQEASGAESGTPGTSGGLFYIGRSAITATPRYFKGWIDEARILDGHAEWTASFTAPTAAWPRS